MERYSQIVSEHAKQNPHGRVVGIDLTLEDASEIRRHLPSACRLETYRAGEEPDMEASMLVIINRRSYIMGVRTYNPAHEHARQDTAREAVAEKARHAGACVVEMKVPDLQVA